MSQASPSLRVCLFGAAPGTRNLGVSALCHSTLAGVLDRAPDADVTVYDFGHGVREQRTRVGTHDFTHRVCGAKNSRRLHRRDSLWNMRVSGWFGGLGNPGIAHLRRADLVLDASGGDSFTDLYGEHRFWTVTLPKRIAIEQKRPLVLLPQTYGPFRSERLREEARSVLRGAASAWARDERSFQSLRELLEDDFDPARHRQGVDLAFGLELDDSRSWPAPATSWLGDNVPVIGLNVSGLCWQRAEHAKKRYGLRADYRDTVFGLAARILRRTEARIVLVPHVLAAPGGAESDYDACLGLVRGLGRKAHGRVMVLGPDYGPSEIKSLIAQFDWFVGTRMHATIAALSTGVPAAALAYSGKFKGVFETCNVGDCVTDARRLDTQDALEHLWSSWLVHDEARKALRQALVAVRGQVREQMDAILSVAAPDTLRRAA
ncbi:MAG: polysaccharide pyruvyl transferase family protein [bacterium]|nr:polysaccharide pyruvyl transferase family protein [bacterium]